MTRDEVKQLLIKITTVYPNFKAENRTDTVNTWEWALRDFTVQDVERALKDYIKEDNGKYPPGIPQLIQIIEKNKQKTGIDWDEVAREIMEGQ